MKLISKKKEGERDLGTNRRVMSKSDINAVSKVVCI